MKRNDPENRKLVDSCWHRTFQTQKHSIMFSFIHKHNLFIKLPLIWFHFPSILNITISLALLFHQIFRAQEMQFWMKNLKHSFDLWLWRFLFVRSFVGKYMELKMHLGNFGKCNVCFFLNLMHCITFISRKLSNYKRMRERERSS